VEWFGRCEALRERANVLVSGGSIDPERSSDEEEKQEIQRLHQLLDRYELDRQVRWIERMDKRLSGEMYRFVADGGGVFVQPALFEAFGLTVIEAMISGLPTFATCYGGPHEIIVDGVSGFYINPNRGDEAAQSLAEFFARCREEPGTWKRVSLGGIDRVWERYTWRLYAEKLMTLSRIYGFWKYMTNLQRQGTQRYLEMFYELLHKVRARSIEA
jgi:sucrose synthase